MGVVDLVEFLLSKLKDAKNNKEFFDSLSTRLSFAERNLPRFSPIRFRLNAGVHHPRFD